MLNEIVMYLQIGQYAIAIIIGLIMLILKIVKAKKDNKEFKLETEIEDELNYIKKLNEKLKLIKEQKTNEK